MVSGCFDLLDAGHVTFLKTASSYGKLYVGLGRDENLLLLKGKPPYFSQEERAYMVNAIKYVEEAFLCSGSGVLDFEPDLKRIHPDFFVVNSDGHTPEKESLCRENGAENPPGVEYLSGSQDQIGLLMPGINRLYYEGGYWPSRIDSTIDPNICDWLSRVMHFILYR